VGKREREEAKERKRKRKRDMEKEKSKREREGKREMNRDVKPKQISNKITEIWIKELFMVLLFLMLNDVTFSTLRQRYR
jgi:hypothetical protein